MLHACELSGVRRVCITSSTAAVCDVRPAEKPQDGVFTESHWSVPEIQSAYSKSKTLAERAAWNFVESMPKESRIELSVVNPCFVVGPPLVHAGFASGKVLSMFMQNQFPGGLPVLAMAAVDVRDVALAHVRCITNDAAQGKRFICADRTLWWRDFGAILSKEFAPMGYPVPTEDANLCLVRFVSLFNAQAAAILKVWGVELQCDATRSKEILGMKFRNIEESLVEMVHKMIDDG